MAPVADQFDASVAWYPTPASAVQLSLFHKEITDFIVDIATNNVADTGIVLPVGISTSFPLGISTSVNGSEASVSGAELSFAHNFTALPGLL